MDVQQWAAFALASLVIALVPGPGVAAIVGFAFASGRRVALAAVAGMALGNAVAISVSLAGAGALLASSALAFTILKWVGALYLIVVGILMRVRRTPAATVAEPSRTTRARTAFVGTLAVGVFHPKTILFFVAFASQFIRSDLAYLPQAAILVATFTAIAACTDTLYALAAARASGLLAHGPARRWLGRAGGGVLVAAGAATAAMRR